MLGTLTARERRIVVVSGVHDLLQWSPLIRSESECSTGRSLAKGHLVPRPAESPSTTVRTSRRRGLRQLALLRDVRPATWRARRRREDRRYPTGRHIRSGRRPPTTTRPRPGRPTLPNAPRRLSRPPTGWCEVTDAPVACRHPPTGCRWSQRPGHRAGGRSGLNPRSRDYKSARHAARMTLLWPTS